MYFTSHERDEVIRYGKKLVDYGLTSGTGGNISLFNSKEGVMLITPSGYDFYEMTANDLVVVDLDGHVIKAKEGLKPSSEWQLHSVFYKNREDIQCIVHAHTTYATVLSCLREELPATHYMVAVAGENIRVADYATFGTEELSLNAYKAMEDRKAVILANHGIVGGEANLEKAFNVIEEVEYCSKIYCLARSIGNPVILDENEMAKMKDKFQNYGKNVKK